MHGGSPLTFLHSAHRPANTFRTDKRFDGYCSLQLMNAGGVELFYDERRWVLEDDPWFWCGFPGPHIRFHVAPGYSSWGHRHVAFTGPRMADWLSEGMLPLEPQRPPPAMAAEMLFDELLSLATSQNHWEARRAVNLLERILLELAQARARAAHPDQDPWLAPILKELSSDRSSDHDMPSYEELAQRAGMSLSTLHRRFKMATGITLHAYTLQCRIAAARELLMETDLPIKAVAQRLGYRDVYFFSRQFADWMGVSPGAYRRQQHF